MNRDENIDKDHRMCIEVEALSHWKMASNVQINESIHVDVQISQEFHGLSAEHDN